MDQHLAKHVDAVTDAFDIVPWFPNKSAQRGAARLAVMALADVLPESAPPTGVLPISVISDEGRARFEAEYEDAHRSCEWCHGDHELCDGNECQK